MYGAGVCLLLNMKRVLRKSEVIIVIFLSNGLVKTKFWSFEAILVIEAEWRIYAWVI